MEIPNHRKPTKQEVWHTMKRNTTMTHDNDNKQGLAGKVVLQRNKMNHSFPFPCRLDREQCMQRSIKPTPNKCKHQKKDLRSLPQASTLLSMSQIFPHILPKEIPVVVFRLQSNGREFKGAIGEHGKSKTMTRQSFVQFLPNISRRNKIETYT